jgi:glutamate--cysteine ligase
MSAQKLADELEDPVLTAADPVDAALAHVAGKALADGPGGRVGLELEFHLVSLADPARRVGWPEVLAAIGDLPAMPSGSAVSVEPGGQVELSTPPAADLVHAVGALRHDEAVLRAELRGLGLGLAALGADPARPAMRVNPAPRYRAMERHFDVVGCSGPARSMMSSTAALQVNLDAGPASGWRQRVRLLQLLVPVLVAASASSPWLAGRTTGSHSMRQAAWRHIDDARTGLVPDGEPTQAWASYALRAPVMLDRLTMRPVCSRTSFAAWLRGDAADPALATRRPTRADLDYHLTTLFPPVRPRGYLEVRCLDALPGRWWPALAAFTVTLADDPVAADLATELCEPVAGRVADAVRSGPAHSAVGRAVRGCLEIAVRHCPDELRAELGDFAELVGSGRTPSGEIRRRIAERGPAAVLEEEAHA